MRELPIGTQSFNLVRMMDMAYVDKTDLICRLVEDHDQCFIARPPCFGKSLLITALESLFSKGTEMFRGLALGKLWTEKTYKVLHFDFSGIDCSSEEAFEMAAVSKLRLAAHHAGFIDREEPEYRKCGTIADLFREIAVRAEDLSMVLLIDEYDSPLRHSLQDREAFEAVSSRLRAFYSVVRQYEGRFRFIFVTGIMRFSSRISGYGQSIYDISSDPQYGALLGFTEEEIRECFGEELRERTASLFHVSPDDATEEETDRVVGCLRRHCGGYCFDDECSVRLFEPRSVLQFLSTCGGEAFSDRWFMEGGSRTNLPEGMSGILADAALNGGKAPSVSWMKYAVSPDFDNTECGVSMLTQRGYFSIREADSSYLFPGFQNLEQQRTGAYLLTKRLKASGGASEEDIYRLNWLDDTPEKEDVTAEGISEYLCLNYKVLCRGEKIQTEEEACRMPVLNLQGSGYDAGTFKSGAGTCGGITVDFIERRVVIALRCVHEGESAEAKLHEAEDLAKNETAGCFAVSERRFALVFSVQEQKIVLSREV